MTILIASALLALCPVNDGVQAQAASGVAKELEGLAAATGQLESYRFTAKSETKREGSGGGGGVRGFGGGNREPVVIEGAWKKDAPMHLKAGEVSAFKQGEQLVHKGEDGTWQSYTAPEGGMRFEGRGPGGGAGGARGEGGDRPPRGAGGERGAAGERGARRGAPTPMRALSTLEAPHALLASLSGLVTEVEKKDGEEGSATYSGELTKKGAEELGGRMRVRMRRGGGGGGGGGDFEPEMEVFGTFSVQAQGHAITQVEFVVTRVMYFGERELETTTTRTIQLADLGQTTYDVPADALAAFQAETENDKE